MKTRIKKSLRPWAMRAVCLIFLFLLPHSASSEETYVFERMWPAFQQPWYFLEPSGIEIDQKGNVYVADCGHHQIQKLTQDGNLIMKFGNSGQIDSDFVYPRDIAIDKDNFIYVCDVGGFVRKFDPNGILLTKWGENGSGEGQFNVPWSIAIDDENSVYVADRDNHRIQKFDSHGTFITKWGDYGSNIGQFSSPSGVAVDIYGHVYVADRDNHRIQKFDSIGNFLTEWGSFGSAEGQFSYPWGVTTDKVGNVYVADENNHRIQKFDSNGIFITKWGDYGSDIGQFYGPSGIAVSESGKIFVTDTNNHRIQVFDSNSTFISSWGASGNDTGLFKEPMGIALDDNGNIYVADTRNLRIQKFDSNRSFKMEIRNLSHPWSISVDNNGKLFIAETEGHQIKKFDSNGSFITEWGSFGTGDGQFKWPGGIAVDNNGFVYVADTYNSRIQKFTSDGTFIKKWGTEGEGDGELKSPIGIATEGSGNVYVTDDNHRIQKFTSDGTFITKWGSLGSGDGEFRQPTGIAIDSSGNVYVADDNDRIQKFDSNGTYITKFGSSGNSAGQLNSPCELAVSSHGLVYVADRDNHRIQVFSPGTAPPPDGEPPPDQEQTIDKAIIVAGGGPFPGNNIWDATQMCANYAYRALTYQGYTKETIYYLTPDTDLDLDGNGILDDVDADATNSNLQYAINTWAQDAGDLFIYIVNHGGDSTFRMGPTELLYATDLDAWLDDIQNTIPGSVTLLYDACRSGSFLPVLVPPAGKERVLATSASSEQEAIFGSQGTISFSFLFWARMFNGDSFYDSFFHAMNSIGVTYPQDPLLEGNGNGIGNEREDQEAARALKLGNETRSAGDIPFIGSVSPSQTLYEETSALLYAAEVIDADGIGRVWAIITPPDYSQDPDQPVTDLPIIDLTSVGNNRYEGIYSNFTTGGTYTIAIYASDRGGVISLPRATTVAVGGSATAMNLYFPHVDTTGSWGTEIALINTSADQTVAGTLNAFSNTGQLIDAMGITLNPHARRQITVADELASHTNIGYLVFEADSETVCGYTKFYVSGQYRVAVPAVQEVNTSDIYLSHIASDENWWTGVSILNTTDSKKTVTITFDNGQSKFITLNGNEHMAFTIMSLCNGQPQPGLHSAVITNASGVIGLELFGSTEGSGDKYLSGILLKDATASTIYYPHTASDEQWWTGIVAFNPSPSDTTLTITPYTDAGTVLATQTLDIPAGGKYIGTASDLGLPLGTAWFKIDSTNPITGFELFGATNGNQLAGYTGVGISGKEGVFAKIEKEGWTGIALVNIESSQTTVVLTAYDNYGNAIAAEAIILGEHEKLVNTAENIFSGKDISTATYIGYSSDKEIVGFQLNGSSDGMMLDGLPGM